MVAPSQWPKFWNAGADAQLIAKQAEYVWGWLEDGASIRVLDRDGRMYQYECYRKLDVRYVLERHSRWDWNMWFWRGECWCRVPGSIDLDAMSERISGKRMKSADWEELVCRPLPRVRRQSTGADLDFDDLPDADDVLRKYCQAAVRKYVYGRVQPDTDRSAIIWKIICTLREHGADASEMAAAAMASHCWKSKIEDAHFKPHRWLRAEIERAIKKTRANG
jgi:hypothetical protein